MRPPPSGPQTTQDGLRNDQGQLPQRQQQQQGPNQRQRDATPPTIPRFAPTHVGAQQGNQGTLNVGQDGGHPAPAAANPSPNHLTNGIYNPTGTSPTNASGANTPTLTSNAQPDDSPHNNNYPAGGPPGAVNGVLRPNSTLPPGLFGNLESRGARRPDLYEGFPNFEEEFGQWFDGN